jgi:hypothetical protein
MTTDSPSPPDPTMPKDRVEEAWLRVAERLIERWPAVEPTLFVVDADQSTTALPGIPLDAVGIVLDALDGKWAVAAFVCEAWVVAMREGQEPKQLDCAPRHHPDRQDSVQVVIYWPGHEPEAWGALVHEGRKVGKWFRADRLETPHDGLLDAHGTLH